MGTPDADYHNAHTFLRQKSNSAALSEITTVMKEKPETQDYGISLSVEVIENQTYFKNKFNELLELVYNNPNDNEKKLLIIYQLEKAEKDMTDEMKHFLDKLKASSIYALSRIHFNRIMEEGINLIKEHKFIEATETFAKGYFIYNQEFRGENLNPILQNEVNTEIKKVLVEIDKYKSIWNEFIKAADKYKTKQFTKNDKNADNEYLNLQKKAKELNAAAKTVTSYGNTLKKIHNREAQKKYSVEETILPFAYRVTLGRENNTDYEGVEGAMQASIFFTFQGIAHNFLTEVNENVKNICSTFNFENDKSVEKNIIAANLYLQETSELYNFQIENLDLKLKENFKSEISYQKNLVELINVLQQMKNLYSPFIKLNNNVSLIVENRVWTATDLRSTDGIIENIEADCGTVENTIRKLNEIENTLAKIKTNESIDTLVKNKYNLFSDKLKNKQLELYENISTAKKISGEKVFDEADKSYSELIKSISAENKERKNLPTHTLKDFIFINKTIENDIHILQRFIDKTENRNAFLNESKVLTKNISNIQNTISKLNKLNTELNSSIDVLNSTLLEIQLAKNEADLRYEEAVKKVKAGDFLGAEKSLELSRNKTNDALMLADDEEYKKITDDRLLKLSKELITLENNIVIKDVRNHLETAKKEYFNGNFQMAEDMLALASKRWAVTHIDENEEIVNWMKIVQTAGLLEAERFIPASAPLYPQITQLLSNATKLYLDSVNKINTNKREEALKNLTYAKENIKQVLLLVPFNETAGQLNLKIDKLIDPVNFSEQFKQKMRFIKNNYKSDSRRCYSDLLDLYAIDKKFNGIEKLKDEIEIYLGIKLPPPDLKAIAESNALTNSAKKIYASRDLLSFPIAIQQLDKAIKLNNNNSEAIKLKDTIQLSIGGAATIILSHSDELKYQKAVAELQKGNKLIAAALVEQLMQSKNAKNSAKVIELKKRIDAQL